VPLLDLLLLPPLALLEHLAVLALQLPAQLLEAVSERVGLS
jgi:hypothetical protein